MISDLQALERRRLLAFNTSFLGGVLRVVGGPDPVNITVTVSLDNFRIIDANDGSTEDVPQSSVGAISLVSLFGDGGTDSGVVDQVDSLTSVEST
jgi:hypothetical protein